MREQVSRLPTARRHFLLLQGPCGPFFGKLQKSLKAQGHHCTRVALNGGDLMAGGRGRKLSYRGSLDEWPQWLVALWRREGVTDIVCYGDCRPYHRLAIGALKPKGVAVHVLEEGYLRPHWITCERDGVNGHSKLAGIDLGRIDENKLDALTLQPEESFESPLWHYMWAGFVHYFWAMLLIPMFPRFESHRDLPVAAEAVLWLLRGLAWPFRRRRTSLALRRLAQSEAPHHLALLQLDGDSQIREHSDFGSARNFVNHCVSEFAAAGAGETLLVFKDHPLNNGIVNLRGAIRDAAIRHGVGSRVLFVETGKLVPLLDRAISVTAVNSTACHQSLRRGIPTIVLGKAVFNHPEIVPRMRLTDFYRLRPVPKVLNYAHLVTLLRETCQVFGGFYSRRAIDIAVPALTKRLIDGSPAPESFLLPHAQPGMARAAP